MCCSLPCLSFSLAPPPPTPTLFPYTTLFRSTRWSPASRDGRSPAGRERDRAEQASGHLSGRSEEHTSELQSRGHLVCRLLLEKKNREDSRGRGITSATADEHLRAAAAAAYYD